MKHRVTTIDNKILVAGGGRTLEEQLNNLKKHEMLLSQNQEGEYVLIEGKSEWGNPIIKTSSLTDTSLPEITFVVITDKGKVSYILDLTDESNRISGSYYGKWDSTKDYPVIKNGSYMYAFTSYQASTLEEMESKYGLKVGEDTDIYMGNPYCDSRISFAQTFVSTNYGGSVRAVGAITSYSYYNSYAGFVQVTGDISDFNNDYMTNYRFIRPTYWYDGINSKLYGKEYPYGFFIKWG